MISDRTLEEVRRAEERDRERCREQRRAWEQERLLRECALDLVERLSPNSPYDAVLREWVEVRLGRMLADLEAESGG